MKIGILPHQINRITQGRYTELHHVFLGLDISDKNVVPIHRGVYYVDAKDSIGKLLISENTPAKCFYHSGQIYCLYDERIPLTEARLVHEFIHRVARRHTFFRWTSGLDTRRSNTLLNEVITEYLTSLVVGKSYAMQVDPRNHYLPYLSEVRQFEKEKGRKAFIEAYFDGNARFFRHVFKDLFLQS